MSARPKDGGPAFPVPKPAGGVFADLHGKEWVPYLGMTLRDWFAGRAMAGFCADPNGTGRLADYAADAYVMADAMLAERDK